MEQQPWPQQFYSADGSISHSIENDNKTSDLSSSAGRRSTYSLDDFSAFPTPYPVAGGQGYVFAPHTTADDVFSSTFPSTINQDYIQVASSFSFPSRISPTLPPAFTAPPSSYSSTISTNLSHSTTNSMAALLYTCLLEAPQHTLPLKAIYAWIERVTHKPLGTRPRWTNTLRHNLSQNGDFLSLSKSHWTLTPEALAKGPTPTSEWRRREADARKKGQSLQPETVFDFSTPPNIALAPRALPTTTTEIGDFSGTPQTQVQTPFYTTTATPEPLPLYALSPSAFGTQHDDLSGSSTWIPEQSANSFDQQQLYYQQPMQQQQQRFPGSHQQQFPSSHQQDFSQQTCSDMSLLSLPNTSTSYNYNYDPSQNYQQQQYQHPQYTQQLRYQQAPFHHQQAPFQPQQSPFHPPQAAMIDPQLSSPAQTSTHMQTSPSAQVYGQGQHDDFGLLNTPAQFPLSFQSEGVEWNVETNGKGKGKARAE